MANIRLVGAITAHVIHMVYEELSLPNTYKVHMIGHSLGMSGLSKKKKLFVNLTR